MSHPVESLSPEAREFALKYRAAVELHARVAGVGAGNGFLAFCGDLLSVCSVKCEVCSRDYCTLHTSHCTLEGSLPLLRRMAREMAEREGQPYLVIEVPPPGMSYQQITPYLVEEAAATDAEKKAGERIEPRARENQ